MFPVNPKRELAWRTKWPGESVHRISILILVCTIALTEACTSPGNAEQASDSMDFGSSVTQEGTVYTPVSQTSDGCLLYSVNVLGGHSPAALVYQSVEGQFSYDQPERCIKSAKVQ